MTRTLSLIAAMVLTTTALAVGCKAPPEAPTELEDLCGYVYDQLGADDPEQLELGLQNLGTWLDAHMDQTLDGYTIANLDEATVDALDERDRSTDGLIGAAVATQSTYSVQDNADVLILHDQDEVAADEYEVYERTFDGDPDSFSQHDTDSLQAQIYTETSFAGIVTVKSTATAQYHWAEALTGTAMPMRTWMVEPADVSLDAVKVNSHYFLSVMLPQDSGSIRLQATWIDANYNVNQETEDFAQTQMVKSMQNMSAQIEAYLDAQ